MPILVSQRVFKQQAKVLVNNWPFPGFKTAYARDILSQLYGYRNSHDYLKSIREKSPSLKPATEQLLNEQYVEWIQKLAQVGSMNHIQARRLLHKLWPIYLSEKNKNKDRLYKASIQFFGECTDFLNDYSESVPIDYTFNDPPSIKDAIEASGVPHPEVGAIKKNGHWVSFDEKLRDGDELEVYPNPSSKAQLLPYKPDGNVEFLLDVHLSALTRYLRMAGFSCLHQTLDIGDAALAEFSAKENLILLTRDIGLLKRSKVRYARWIRNVLPELQFKEVVEHYQLKESFKPMSLCVKCNGRIEKVDKEIVEKQVPEGVYDWQDEFKQCMSCRQVYWKGSHFEKIQKILDNVKSRS
ncbi:Mut7-C RNAse domain-containing protein [Agarilytica rhodophyticola]|uniref:Mut7-C RNAse domain-containing protein n=1 Tax=Agarilytica rhodophyticola TaxID=1737490 RepID=UPI000B3416D6|nr:Mut7-C RNAse domain-containing protein [Agarilytica rhodophyticola]